MQIYQEMSSSGYLILYNKGSADKKTHNYNTGCSNHNSSQSP